MAAKKEVETVRLTHGNGATVVVAAEKAERLLASAGWSKPGESARSPAQKKTAAKRPAKKTAAKKTAAKVLTTDDLAPAEPADVQTNDDNA